MADGRLIWVDGESHASTPRPTDDLPTLLADPTGWLWLDLPEPDAETATLLTDVFGVHPTAVQDVLERNHVPRLHVYGQTLFVVLHRPDSGEHGHVHYLEIDQFVGSHFLITTHGPRSPSVPLERLLGETDEVAAKMLAGRFRPASPAELSHRIVSMLTLGEEKFVNTLARDVGLLEQRVMAHAGDEDPRGTLEQLFGARHALLTVRTMTTQSAEVYGRAIRLLADADKSRLGSMRDTKDQYDRLARISGSQLDFLAGVTEYYRARTDTKMTIAAERLAVIAAITLPVTAISSVVGMNVIVNATTHWEWLAALLAVMVTLSLVLLRWAKRQGWW